MEGKFSPQALICARESRKLTQAELSRLSGIDQSTVSRAESGLIEPTRQAIDAWARALGYPVALFTRQPRPYLPATFYRKRASMPARDAKAIRATLALRRQQLEDLFRSVDAVDANVAVVNVRPAGPTPVDVARQLRASWRMPPGPVANLTRTVEDNGILVLPVDFGAGRIDGVSIYDAAAGLPPTMFISIHAPPDRQRFTLAHELGHVLMHLHLPVAPDDCEEEANAFGAEFLMPADDIRHEFSPSLGLPELAHLKLRWGVSMQALVMRAQALGRISTARAQRLFRLMSSLGYRSGPEPVELPREEPQLVRQLVRVHTHELGFSDSEVAAAVALEVDEFRALYGSLEGRVGAPFLRRVK